MTTAAAAISNDQMSRVVSAIGYSPDSAMFLALTVIKKAKVSAAIRHNLISCILDDSFEGSILPKAAPHDYRKTPSDIKANLDMIGQWGWNDGVFDALLIIDPIEFSKPAAIDFMTSIIEEVNYHRTVAYLRDLTAG